MEPQLNDRGKAILAIIEDAGGVWTDSAANLGKEIGISKNAVKRALAWLTAYGFLVSKRRKGRPSKYEIAT